MGLSDLGRREGAGERERRGRDGEKERGEWEGGARG